MKESHQQEIGGFVQKNMDVIVIILIIICVLLLFCCALLSYMVYLYRHELNNYKKEAINETISFNKDDIITSKKSIKSNNSNSNSNNSNHSKDIVNITEINESLDITANPNNNNLRSIPVTPASVLENDSINDLTIYNTCNSKNYNKKFVSINSEDNILTNLASPKQTFDTSSNINDYLTHSYSYSTHLDKPNKYRYHHRKNNSFVNSSHRRFPSLSVKKPRNLYERQSSISSTLGSVKSMIKRHYSIRSKNHSRNHSSSNSKVRIYLLFIN